MLSSWLTQLSDDGHVEQQHCLALAENPCTLSETATAHFQELLCSTSPLGAPETLQVFCSLCMSKGKSWQEVHLFLYWAQRGPEYCRIST